MNLTLSAIENIQDGCKHCRSMLVNSRGELIEQLEAVEEMAAGCISMLNDLSNARDALRREGVTAEWLETFNEGNALFTMANIEAPRFFGTPKDRIGPVDAGLENFIWDWLTKAGKALAAVFAWIFKALKWIFDFWVDDQRAARNSEMIRWLDGQTKKLKEQQAKANAPILDPAQYEISVYDMKQVFNYLIKTRALVTCLSTTLKDGSAGDLRSSLIGEETANTGDVTQDICAALIRMIYSAGFRSGPNSILENGFEITSHDYKFLDLQKIPQITVNPATPDSGFNQEYALLAEFDKFAPSISELVKRARTHIATLENELNKMWNAAKNGKTYGNSQKVMDPESLGLRYNRARVYGNFFAQALVFTTTLTSAYSQAKGNLINSMSRYMTDYNAATLAAQQQQQQQQP